MRVHPAMVRLTPNKEIRVWLNENPIKNMVSQRAEREEDMVADIGRIISVM
jgi:hypothetical protein